MIKQNILLLGRHKTAKMTNDKTQMTNELSMINKKAKKTEKHKI